MTKTNDVKQKLKLKLKPPSFQWGRHKHRRIISRYGCGSPALESRLNQIVLQEPPSVPFASTSALPLPWNLRYKNRTIALNIEENRATGEVREMKRTTSRSRRLRSKKEEPMLKLQVALTKSEIEEDFMKMVGKKPPSRPKRRTRAAQAAVELLFFGMSLEEIPRDRYDVPDESPSIQEKVKEKKKV